MFAEEIRNRIADGARCIRFETVYSMLFATIRRQSAVYLTFSWQERYLRGIWFSFFALICGPWGIPWGLFWTPWAIWVNISGGVDCTDEVLEFLDTQLPENHPVSNPTPELHPAQ